MLRGVGGGEIVDCRATGEVIVQHMDTERRQFLHESGHNRDAFKLSQPEVLSQLVSSVRLRKLSVLNSGLVELKSRWSFEHAIGGKTRGDGWVAEMS
jgi:hypothetical protein